MLVRVYSRLLAFVCASGPASESRKSAFVCVHLRFLPSFAFVNTTFYYNPLCGSLKQKQTQTNSHPLALPKDPAVLKALQAINHYRDSSSDAVFPEKWRSKSTWTVKCYSRSKTLQFPSMAFLLRKGPLGTSDT